MRAHYRPRSRWAIAVRRLPSTTFQARFEYANASVFSNRIHESDRAGDRASDPRDGGVLAVTPGGEVAR